MLRILLTPRWLAGTAVAVVFMIVAIWLGGWQFDRHQDRSERRDRIEANYAAAPIDLATVIPEIQRDGRLPAARDWTRVTFSAEYAVEEQLFVRNRPFRGTYGYHLAGLAQPVDTSGEAVIDQLILIDRGWIGYGPDAATLPEVDPAPEGTLTITGWLRPSETGFDRMLPERQLSSLSAVEAAEETGLDVAPLHLILESEVGPDGSVPDRPQAADPPDTDVGSHLAYALQWWLASPLGFGLIWVMVRREHQDSLLALSDGDCDTDGEQPRRKPRKHRIWDDEDE